MKRNHSRYAYRTVKDEYGDYFDIRDTQTDRSIATTIYWQVSPREQMQARRDAILITKALNAYRPNQQAQGEKHRYIYGPDREGCNDLFVVQDSTTGKDLACTIHWGEGEEIETERSIVLITRALNAYRPSRQRKARIVSEDRYA